MLSILVNIWHSFMELLEQVSFFQGSWNEYNKSYAMIKTEPKVKFLSWFSMHLGNIIPCGPLSTDTTQKLKYTCRWLRFHNDLRGFNSDGMLSHWQQCHKPFGFLVWTTIRMYFYETSGFPRKRSGFEPRAVWLLVLKTYTTHSAACAKVINNRYISIRNLSVCIIPNSNFESNIIFMAIKF